MRRLVPVLLPLALLTITGCAPRRHQPAAPHPCTPRTPPAEARAPEGARTAEDVDRLFAERLNAGDVDGVVALYEPDATLIRQDRSAASGTAAIRDEITGLVALRPHMTLNIIRVLMAGGDLAVVSDDWSATGTDRGKHVAFRGRASEVVRRQPDGTWRIVIDDPDARGAACGETDNAPAKRHGRAPKRR